MTNSLRNRSSSLSTVVLVLLVIVFLQGSISIVTLTGIAASAVGLLAAMQLKGR